MKLLTAICFITGILLAGQNGSWFPWINYLGGFIFALTVPLAARIKE
jgi:hypothetical protein